METGTLGQIYDKLSSGMRDAKDMQVSEATQTLSTLVAVLEEGQCLDSDSDSGREYGFVADTGGPDYLIDTLILELITHHAEAIERSHDV
jgi:hypothetical protein